ncbi:EthD domain-containing protein [Shimazuella sp. AN120528]|uniref:EthD domain-containing protein n=1 Tax=Shimazuella soli TaxID=1892854 RepID=UPI001F107C53|nr:EthD domain-containing protein [Shimazuella soli]MCH5586680.1 EthD domain-containing protein [Shimazuella soli]
MVKVQGLYRNINDLEEFEVYYTKVIIPKILSVPGVIKIDFTTLYHSTNKQPEGLNDIHVITETYFESLEEMKRILSSEEGIAILKLVAALGEDSTEIASFMAQEKVVYAPKWLEKKTEEGEVIEIVDLNNLEIF